MPIRHARSSDIPIMAQVLAASFGPDQLFRIMFPHQDEFPEDLVTAFRRKLRESWWDYSKVLMVSYETQTSNPKDPDDENHVFLTTRKGQKEVITGMVEWQRVGLGWEHVWNLWGWWDPSKWLLSKTEEASCPLRHWDTRHASFFGARGPHTLTDMPWRRTTDSKVRGMAQQAHLPAPTVPRFC